MKSHKFVPVVLFALVLMTGSALAQSTTNSQKSPNFSDLIFGRLHLGSPAKAANPQGPARDAVALGLAKAKVYKFASADFPGEAASFVADRSLGTILGVTSNPLSPIPFTLVQSRYQLLAVPGALSTRNTFATGINTGGEIVGTYFDTSNVQHGFLLNGGVVTNIDDPSAATGTTGPLDINDGGEIVGAYADAGGVGHGFSTADGITFTAIDFPGAINTSASGVNTAGDTVGQWEDASAVTHGFLLHGGVFTSFDFPLATSTFPNGINDSNVIVGSFHDASNVNHGFVYCGGIFFQVEVPGAAQTLLTRVKNNGQVTGFYLDGIGEAHGLTGH
jgi:hypothetical protein